MANFAIAASQSTIEYANQVLSKFAQEGDRKEDTLKRILDIVSNENVRASHPALEEKLRTVDGTIATLIKQINGIVSGQDAQIAITQEKLDQVLLEKNDLIAQTKAEMEKARDLQNEAKSKMEQVEQRIAEIQEQSDNEIAAAKKDAAIQIEKANLLRDQALKEKNASDMIADEINSKNQLLVDQAQKLRDDIAADQALYSILLQEKKDLELKNRELEHDMIKQAGKYELDREKALKEKELEIREQYEAKLREADKENIKLQLMIEQLQKK